LTPLVRVGSFTVAMPASSAHARPSTRGVRRGFTLIELLVVLLLMGLAFALVAPSLARPSAPERDPAQRVLDAARAAAVRRGETMLLDVRADGRWTVIGTADSVPLLAGALAPARALRLTISPLGACMPDLAGDATTGAAAWDPLRCALPDARIATAGTRP
jgi:prepilin-type N-terminal cleavage/methylation domain-containing protein